MTDISIGKHHSFSEKKQYAFHYRVFCYLESNQLDKITLIYEQSESETLLTEIRKITVNNVRKNIMDTIEITYAKWSGWATNKTTSNKQLLSISDKQDYPKNAVIQRYKLQEISHHKKYNVLIDYRNSVKQLIRQLDYRRQVQGKSRELELQHSLNLGYWN